MGISWVICCPASRKYGNPNPQARWERWANPVCFPPGAKGTCGRRGVLTGRWHAHKRANNVIRCQPDKDQGYQGCPQRHQQWERSGSPQLLEGTDPSDALLASKMPRRESSEVGVPGLKPPCEGSPRELSHEEPRFSQGQPHITVLSGTRNQQVTDSAPTHLAIGAGVPCAT